MKANKAMVLAVVMFAIGAILTFAVSNSNIRFAGGSGGKYGFIAPTGDLSSDSISVYDNKIEIISPDKKFIRGVVGPTQSMTPVFGAGATLVESEFNEKDINGIIGRIISFNYNGVKYVHQVVSTGQDENGWYAVTKGTNNVGRDDVRVRSSDIIGIVEMVIYTG